ncbi:MAG: TldD/PmbA family protein [Candidatus Heimdallarchaeota archaeon]
MSLFSFAQDAISYALNDEVDYVDVRLENVFKNYIGMRNSKLCGVNTQLQESIGVRILLNGFWGFAATASLDTPSIKSAVESSLLSAKKIAKRFPEKKNLLAEMTARKTSVADECKKSPQLIDPSERMDFVSELNSRINSSVQDLTVLDIKLVENNTQKIFLNSDGTEIEQILIRASVFLGSSMQGSSTLPKIRTVGFGGVGGIEQFQTLGFENFITDFTSSLPKIAQARLIKPVEQPVILNEEMGWNLCHEFCHAVESDLILEGRSSLGNQIGTKIGSEKVTIIDDASFKGYGEYYFDDEGVKASGTLIIEDGILFDVLQSRETAGEMNAIPTSNGRAESSLHLPLVRQSNTFFEPGNFSFDELLENTRSGLYICDSFGGISDTVQGNFQLDAQYGRKIEKGELGDYVTNFSLVGNLFSVLGTVDGMTKDLGSYPAYCNKGGQSVRVGAISPKVSLKNLGIITNIAQRQIRKVDFTKMRER